MKLIVITTPTFFTEEHEILNALFEEGMEYLHLRKPHTEAIYSERLLSLIPEQYHKRIITHDHFYLKEEFNLLGIHLNHRNPEIPDKYSGHISCSCHSIDDVKRRKALCSYVFLSPVFDSISKSGYNSNYSDLELLRASKEGVIDRKVMALGGISLDNIQRAKDLGFGGAAVLGDLWNQFDPYTSANYKDLIAHFKKLKKAAE